MNNNGDLPEILNIDEAAALLGVSIKTFNKVLHTQNLPARKIGREWKFSRSALIAWVGSGNSAAFYREGSVAADETNGAEDARSASAPVASSGKTRRTAGWRIEFD
jgi:excisionase family DNA binding protein